MAIDSRTRELMSIAARLFSKKDKVNQRNQLVAEHMYPMRADFTEEREDGEDFAGLIYDSYPLLARETLQTNIGSMLRQGPWFEVKTGDEAIDEKVENAMALEYGTKRMMEIINSPRSGWGRASIEADGDWVAFGNPVLSVEESGDRRELVIRAWHPKSNAWMVDENGIINANFRKFKMQARNMVAMKESGRWKGELHADVRLAMQTDPTQEFNCLHILQPTEHMYASDGRKMRDIRHPFLSCYVDCDHETYLNEMGAPVFNYVIPRWRTLGVDPNGWSPAALNAIPDAMMLQDMGRVIIEQGEKAVDPPTIGVGNVFTRDLNFMAGGHTAVDLDEDRKLQDVFGTVETSRGISIGLELQQDVRNLIAESFLLNKLFLPSVREMRELEVAVRTEEFRRAALPFFTPIEDEYHSPLLGVVFEMGVNMRLIRADMFPEDLQGKDTVFTFHSPLNEAEGRKKVENFYNMIQVISAGAQVDQTVANMFDIRQGTLDAVRSNSEPDWILSDREIKKKNAEADVQKQLTQAAAIASQGAGVVTDAAQAKVAAAQAGM